jgi:phosphate/phosphite/phosphonate ABC transporter binding protein
MAHRALTTIAFLGILIALVSCGAASTTAPTPTAVPLATPAATKLLVLGDISNEPAKSLKSFQPLADYLTAHLDTFGVSVKVKLAPDLATMARWMQAGEVDLYFDSPYPAMIVSDQSGAQPILRRWKGGDAEYDTVFITRANSGLDSLADLQGRVIGFEDNFSTSGYLLPKTYLLRAGMQPVEKSDPQAEVAKDEVGYIFTQDSENTIQWVLSGRVVAGAIDSSAFSDIPSESRTVLTVLAETEKVARHVVLARAGMEPTLLSAIKTVLLDMDRSTEGQAVLKAFEKTAKFDEFPTAADLNRMRQLYEMIREK